MFVGYTFSLTQIVIKSSTKFVLSANPSVTFAEETAGYARAK